MNMFEITLQDANASLKGITDTIHKKAQTIPLRRIEIRYSTASKEPLDAKAALLLLPEYMRQCGQNTAEVSVRANDCPIDNALGRHVLRFFPKNDAKHVDPPAPALKSWWQRLLAWLNFANWGSEQRTEQRIDPSVAPTSARKASETPSPKHQASPDEQREAALKLGKALARGIDSFVINFGPMTIVSHAKIITRLKDVNDAVRPLIDDHKKTMRWITRELTAKNLKITASPSLSYDYDAEISGDGTTVSCNYDLEIRLIPESKGQQSSDSVSPPSITEDGTTLGLTEDMPEAIGTTFGLLCQETILAELLIPDSAGTHRALTLPGIKQQTEFNRQSIAKHLEGQLSDRELKAISATHRLLLTPWDDQRVIANVLSLPGKAIEEKYWIMGKNTALGAEPRTLMLPVKILLGMPLEIARSRNPAIQTGQPLILSLKAESADS